MAHRETIALQLLLLGVSCYMATTARIGDQHHSRSGLSKTEEDERSLSEAVELLRESLLDEEERMAVPNSKADTCQLDDLLQGCLLNCISESLDCSSTCDESKKKASIANIINELTFSCKQSELIESEFEECLKDWIKENIDHDHDFCMSEKNLQSSLLACNPMCTDKSLSNPLDPYNPTSCPGVLAVDFSLGNFNRPKSDDLCSGESGDEMKRGGGQPYAYKTAKLQQCESNNCGDHGYSYKWCYTCCGGWDYCCSGECGYFGYSYRWCNSGSTWSYCNN